MRVMYIWASSSPNGQRNLRTGLETDTWGFKRPSPEYNDEIELVVFGRQHSGGSPRMSKEAWEEGRCDVIVTQRTGAFYEGKSLNWEDEVAAGAVIYPVRCGITQIGQLPQVSCAVDGPLGVGASALQMSGITNRGIVEDVEVDELLALIGVNPTGISLQGSAGADPDAVPEVRKRRGGQGRVQDPAMRSAIERRAVAVATEQLEKEGWSVEELGAPYDLVCTRPGGREMHVEVKGTTGAGTTVILTPNEVSHFRNCPQADEPVLMIVSDILVGASGEGPSCSGGRLRRIDGYRAPAEDLAAVSWQARVAG